MVRSVVEAGLAALLGGPGRSLADYAAGWAAAHGAASLAARVAVGTTAVLQDPSQAGGARGRAVAHVLAEDLRWAGVGIATWRARGVQVVWRFTHGGAVAGAL